jgi:hypothetical protein
MNWQLALGVVIGLVALGVVMPVGIQVSTQIYNVVNGSDMSTDGRTAFDALYEGIWGGYNLLSISPTVLAGGAIIAILVASFAYFSFGGRR